MKLEMKRSDLVSALEAASQGLSGRATLPITRSFFLQAGEGLTATGTDLDVCVKAAASAQVEEPGELCVPGRLFLDVVTSMEGDEVVLESGNQPARLKVTAGRNVATFNVQDSDEFPPMPKPKEDAQELSPPADKLEAIARRVVFSAATEEDRPVLTAVCLTLEEGRLEAAAADGFRLAVLKVPVDASLKARALVPARVFKVLRRFVEDDPVAVVIDCELAQFRAGSVEVTSRQIQGTYPDYRRLVPDGYKTRAIADTSEFIASARFAGA